MVRFVAVAALLGCNFRASLFGQDPPRPKPNLTPVILRDIEKKFAPDPHMGIFHISLQTNADAITLLGELDTAEAKSAAIESIHRTGAKTVDHITVLPEQRFGEKTWGIATLSVASGREEPDHKAELGTQILMGRVVR